MAVLHRVARDVGRTVGELDALPLDEFMGWIAYYDLEAKASKGERDVLSVGDWEAIARETDRFAADLEWVNGIARYRDDGEEEHRDSPGCTTA